MKAIFFDLDYTLYDQWQYLWGAFWDVACVIANQGHLPAETIYKSLLAIWNQVGTDYGYLFNDLLNQLGLYTPDRIQRCVDAFHMHQPKGLTLYPRVDEILCDLKNSYLLGLITDGDISMQQSKVKALNLEEQFDLILYVRQISLRKPDPRIFQYVLHQTNLSPAEAVYVGDHPLKDIVVARRVGLLAVRVMTGEFRSLPDDPFYPPNYYLASLNDLPKIIHSVNTFVGI